MVVSIELVSVNFVNILEIFSAFSPAIFAKIFLLMGMDASFDSSSFDRGCTNMAILSANEPPSKSSSSFQYLQLLNAVYSERIIVPS